MEWVLTQHSVEQFIRRYEFDKDFNTAKGLLLDLLNSAKQDGKTDRGDQIWVSGLKPECRMVVKDRVCCITVLPPSRMKIGLAEEIEYTQAVVSADKERARKNIKDEIEKAQARLVELDVQRDLLRKQLHQIGDQKSNLHNYMLKLTNELEML
jgi:hypothetical protein